MSTTWMSAADPVTATRWITFLRLLTWRSFLGLRRRDISFARTPAYALLASGNGNAKYDKCPSALKLLSSLTIAAVVREALVATDRSSRFSLWVGRLCMAIVWSIEIS